jgi:hypothetical protein
MSREPRAASREPRAAKNSVIWNEERQRHRRWRSSFEARSLDASEPVHDLAS